MAGGNISGLPVSVSEFHFVCICMCLCVYFCVCVCCFQYALLCVSVAGFMDSQGHCHVSERDAIPDWKYGNCYVGERDQ